MSMTANDLKTRGVGAIEALLAVQPEAVISVRGKDRFVVMDIAQYHYLRECELDSVLAQSQADRAAGRFIAESAESHVARLVKDISTAPRSVAGAKKSAAKALAKPSFRPVKHGKSGSKSDMNAA